MNGFPGMPPDVSTHGGQIDGLMLYIHIVMAVLFVGWMAFFIYLLVRFRASKNPTANYAGTKSKFSKYLEVGVAVVEAVLLVAFSIPIYNERVSQFPPEEEAVRVHLIAEQFAWNIHYPGADGIFGARSIDLIDQAVNPIGLDRDSPGGADDIVKVNRLHVPVNTPVIVELSTKDVIHCFSLPVMRIKQDIIPGMNIPVWFEAKDTIESEIACAQLCGLGHYRMKGFLTVSSREDYDQFLADEAALLGGEDEDDFWDE